MAGNNYGTLKILTKNKAQIISIDPKDISVDGCCVYAYPRNKSFAEVENISKTLLGEYRDRIYAMEAILQIFYAISTEKTSYAMPDEVTLEPLILKKRDINMSGIEDAVLEEACYTEEIITVSLEVEEYLYIYGKMRIEDAGTNVLLEMRASMREEAIYDFFVYDNEGYNLESYEDVRRPHEYCISRYNLFMKIMENEAIKKNDIFLQKLTT